MFPLDVVWKLENISSTKVFRSKVEEMFCMRCDFTLGFCFLWISPQTFSSLCWIRIALRVLFSLRRRAQGS